MGFSLATTQMNEAHNLLQTRNIWQMRVDRWKQKAYYIDATTFITRPVGLKVALPRHKRGRGRSHTSVLTFRGAVGGRIREQ